MKISLTNKKLLTEFGRWIGAISTVFSLILIFYEIPGRCKKLAAIILVLILIALYIFLWYRANKITEKNISINGMNVTVKKGDIFSSVGLKIIPFNEYFDTKVDDKLISSKTLNGVYLSNHCHDILSLDDMIIADTRLNPKQIVGTDNGRLDGKPIRYKLGSIYKNHDYLLLAFSKFDQQNRAYLDSNNFLSCLFNMWNELDIVYDGYDINLPLVGTGITRKRGMNLSEQEILECILFTLKTSGVVFSRKTKVNILICQDDIDKINFYALKN